MALRTIMGAMLALAIAGSPALACKGEEIFSDDFADDSGMWGSADFFKIGGGFLELKLQPGYKGVALFQGGQQKEFDACVDITYPEAKKPDGGTVAGFVFWFKDWPNHYVVGTTPVGAVGAYRMNKDKFGLQSPFRTNPAIKAGAGAKNTFRVTVKGNAITIYANDQRVAGFRGTPEDAWMGLFSESEQDNSNAWKFSNFKLTEPPQ
jgi:hypothetical protein